MWIACNLRILAYLDFREAHVVGRLDGALARKQRKVLSKQLLQREHEFKDRLRASLIVGSCDAICVPFCFVFIALTLNISSRRIHLLTTGLLFPCVQVKCSKPESVPCVVSLMLPSDSLWPVLLVLEYFDGERG